MIARGQKFVSLRGIHHKSYHGSAQALAPFRDRCTHGELDAFPLWTTAVFRVFVQIITPANTLKIRGRIIIDTTNFATCCPSMNVDFTYDSEPLNIEDGGIRFFSDEEFMICKHEIAGFSLDRKCWCFFNVDLIENPDLNSTAFDHLCLPSDQKKMIHSLVDVHRNDGSGFDDIIKGKGKGMVFVLHGVPGVGKTLTAGKYWRPWLCRSPC